MYIPAETGLQYVKLLNFLSFSFIAFSAYLNPRDVYKKKRKENNAALSSESFMSQYNDT